MENIARIDRIRFYEQFQRERAIFIACVQGPQSVREQYASHQFNQLLFIHFVQKQGFLAGNVRFLSHKLEMVQQKYGKNRFFPLYCRLLQHLFYQAAQESPCTADDLLCDIPHLSTELFAVYDQACDRKNMHIPDTAFARIFSFFDSYQWCIDEHSQRNVDAIHPDIIGYLFERHINQKQMGAYYTHTDITHYMSQSTIIPHIFKAVEQKYPDAFKPDGLLWQLLSTNPERYMSNALRTSAYLPAEAEREYQSRQRLQAQLKSELAGRHIYSIDQFISRNLNSSRLAQDMIRACKDSALLRAFYESITAITILDPTCGSGAFLFAALNVLEPLYAACLASMQHMLTSIGQDLITRSVDMALFRDVLEQVDRHPNRNYFILKTITINNLYGVDIMPEAVEICKLRLFLKLVAQLKPEDTLEPLADIDFNIYAGNTLVGFAHSDEVSKAIGLQSNVDVDAALESIEQDARLVERELADLRRSQTRLDAAPEETKQRKHYLRDVQKQLCTMLNRYLASQYGIGQRDIPDPTAYEQAFTAWCTGHQPFHWFIDFHAIMERGGFDVILGNPPYVEYSKVRHAYRVRGYATEGCGNLYAAVTERSLTLCRDGQSYLGLVVPLSICGGERFDGLRRMITRNTSALWLSNFEIFPCRLFEGAFQRLSILLAQHGSGPDCAISSTRIQRWYASERPQIIDLITYTPTRRVVKTNVFPKIASALQETILRKLTDKACGGRIATTLHPHKTDHFVYYQEATNYWMKATCNIPYYKKNGVVMRPAHGRFLYFGDGETARTIMALMNSSLFYVWFATFSDGFHLAHALVKEFPVASDLYTLPELPTLAMQLERDIQVHTRISTRNTKPGPNKEGHLIELAEYRMSYSKELLDEIDCVLAEHYGLNEEELDFVINYDIKYRMGREAGSREDSEE